MCAFPVNSLVRGFYLSSSLHYQRFTSFPSNKLLAYGKFRARVKSKLPWFMHSLGRCTKGASSLEGEWVFFWKRMLKGLLLWHRFPPILSYMLSNNSSITLCAFSLSLWVGQKFTFHIFLLHDWKSHNVPCMLLSIWILCRFNRTWQRCVLFWVQL